MNTTISLNNKQINLPINSTISSASNLHTGSHITPVYLNLYDLGGCSNTCIHSIGLSFYHCAVQTHLAEYGYMGHPYKFTGLYKTSKYDSRFHLYRLRDSIEIGWTWFNEKEIDQIVNDLKPFYMGLDYHTTKKNSIHFAKYLLEQLSNDLQLKYQIIQFPSYIDRGRRLSETLEFLQIFDREKDIAEINILYFLYMKYDGNIKQICQILKYDTIDKLKRSIKLIKQGIQEKKLPIFSSILTFDMNITYDDYLFKENNPENLSNNEQLTLTDIFHQFDTITLRGRTSIDRYLNQQSQIENEQRLNIELPRIGKISEEDNQMLPTSSLKHNVEYPAVSQNRDRTPLTSPPASNVSGLAMTLNNSPTPIIIDPSIKFDHLHMCTTVPIGTARRLQETPHSDSSLTELHLRTNVDHNSFSLVNNRQRKLSSSSRKRKLPRDLELTSDLYTITNQNSLRHNYTNNAIPSFSYVHQHTDSNV